MVRSISAMGPERSIDRPTFLAQARRLTISLLGPLAEAIDRHGVYPKAELKQLAASGVFSAHLRTYDQPADVGLSILLIAEVARVCGSSGFVGWCQAACGVYLEESGNPALMGALLQAHIIGQGLGGTGLSNPIKSYAGIEQMLLKAIPEGDGYLLSGTLPWVSHLQSDGYCGVIARVVENGQVSDRDIMVLLPGDAEGVTLMESPAFSGMEGTSTVAVRLRSCRVGKDAIVAEDARSFLRRIRPVFVLLQCGLGLGVMQGAIDSIGVMGGSLSHVNRHLEDQAEGLQVALEEIKERLLQLATTPENPEPSYLLSVLEARAAVSEWSLRAAQAALLHHGARGYLASSPVQRRVRESHFVAIVTPALKQLRKEIASLRDQLQT